jgi:integrase
MTPTELLEEAEAEIEARILPRKQKIKQYIIGFREYLENKKIGDRNLAPMSVENRITGIRSFYKSFDIIIPGLPRLEETAKTLEVHKKIPDKEDIRTVLEICDPLEKAIILIGSSSGLSINEICNLKIKDFKQGYDIETGTTTLQLRREKVNYDFVTFLTPEASRAVLNYLEHRSRTPKSDKQVKQNNQLLKQKVVSDDGYLLICRHISDRYLIKPDEKLRKLKVETAQNMYRTLCEDAQTNADKGIWNIFRSHNLRKWFNNRLVSANCDPMIREFMMGHQISDKTKASYFVADPTELKEMFKNFIPYLTIQKELNVSESPEYQRIKHENVILQAETARHVVERSELQELRAELDSSKKMLSAVWSAYSKEGIELKEEEDPLKDVDKY